MLCFSHVEFERTARHPQDFKDALKSYFGQRRQGWSRKADLQVFCIEMEVESVFVDEITQREGVEGEEKGINNRALWNTHRKLEDYKEDPLKDTMKERLEK